MNNCLKAKWIVPMDGPPVKNGKLLLADDKILDVENSSDLDEKSESFLASSNQIILPGFINLHSHLDYSNIGFNQKPLFDWIVNLVGQTKSWQESDFYNSALAGAKMALATGTTFIVDSSYSGKSAIAMAEIGLKGIVGLEIFGVDQTLKEKAFQFWQARFKKLCSELEGTKSQNIELTIAPHAPYTVSPALFKLCVDWANKSEKILLTHLSESSLENNWFLKGEPLIDDYLRKVLPPQKSKSANDIVEAIDWNRTGKSSFKTLVDEELIKENTLLAHCIHLEESEIEELERLNASVAHCPRSNQNLENGTLNLSPLLNHRIRLGLGTDSLAGTQSLSLLDEARQMVNCQKTFFDSSYDLEHLALRLITIEAAKAIKKEEWIGSLTPGKQADFVVLSSSDDLESLDAKSIYSQILSKNCQVSSVFVDGKCLVDNSRGAFSTP